MQSEPPVRPKLTSRALRRWVPSLVRHLPALATAYLLPGRVSPRTREAAMLGVTSINRCEACEAVHGRWAAGIGLQRDALTADEAAAYAFGQRRRRVRSPRRVGHRRTCAAATGASSWRSSILIELANLAGNRFLAPRPATPGLQVGDLRTARVLDARHARGRSPRPPSRPCPRRRRRPRRHPGDRHRDRVEPRDLPRRHGRPRHRRERPGPLARCRAAPAASHGASPLSREMPPRCPSPTPPSTRSSRRSSCARSRDVGQSLREARRVLRPGGTIRLLEHARARHRAIGALQERSAPAWARVSGGCRLDHDVLRAVRDAGLVVIEQRQRAGGVLVEIVAA